MVNTFELIESYKEKISIFFANANNCPQAINVLKYLLEIHVSTYNDQVAFATRLKQQLNNNHLDNKDFISELDAYFSYRLKNPYSHLDKAKEDFYALLAAYFYYYTEYHQPDIGLYEANKNEQLKKQLLYPLGIYKKNSERNHLENILKKSSEPEKFMRNAACRALGTIHVPADLKPEVIKVLRSYLNDESSDVSLSACLALSHMTTSFDDKRYEIEPALFKIRQHSLRLHTVACKTFNLIGLPNEQYLILQTVLSKIESDNLEFIRSAGDILKNLSIPDAMMNIVINKLLEKLDKYSWYFILGVCNPLNKIQIPSNQIDQVIDALITTIINDYRPETIQALCQTLNKIGTTYEKLPEIHQRLYLQFQSLSQQENASYLVPIKQGAIAFALASMNIPCDMQEKMIDTFIHKLAHCDIDYSSNSLITMSRALKVLAKWPIPVDRQVIVLEKLLSIIHSDICEIRELACKVLAKIKIPAEMQQEVAKQLLTKFEKNNKLICIAKTLLQLDVWKAKAKVMEILTQLTQDQTFDRAQEKDVNVTLPACKILYNMPASNSLQKTLIERILNIASTALKHQNWYVFQCAYEVITNLDLSINNQWMVAQKALAHIHADGGVVALPAISMLANLKIPTDRHLFVADKLIQHVLYAQGNFLSEYELSKVEQTTCDTLMQLAKQFTFEENIAIVIKLESLARQLHASSHQLSWLAFTDQFKTCHLVSASLMDEIKNRTDKLPNEMWGYIRRFI